MNVLHRCAWIFFAGIALTATNKSCGEEAHKLSDSSPLVLVPVQCRPSLPTDVQEIRNLVERVGSTDFKGIERANAARSLAGTRDFNAVEELSRVLKGGGDPLVGIACAEALKWSAAAGDKRALDTLCNVIWQPEMDESVHHAIATGLLDSIGAPEIYARLTARLDESKTLPIDGQARRTVNEVWSDVMTRIRACHFASVPPGVEHREQALEKCLRDLDKLEDDALARYLRDGGDMICTWIWSSKRSPEHWDKVVGMFAARGFAVKQIIYKMLTQFGMGGFHGQLRVDTLQKLRKAATEMPKLQQPKLQKIIRQACLGQERQILVDLSVSLPNAARELIVKRAAEKTTTKEAFTKVEPAERENIRIALDQIANAAVDDDEFAKFLLELVQSDNSRADVSVGAAHGLERVVRARGNRGASIAEKALPLVKELLREYQGAGMESYTGVRASIGKLILDFSPRDNHIDTLDTTVDGFRDHLSTLVSFLHRVSPMARVRGFNIRLAEETVLAYERVMAMTPAPPNRDQLLYLLLDVRQDLSPEKLPLEVDPDLPRSLVPPGHTPYRPPAEWRAWLERFKALPQFKKGK